MKVNEFIPGLPPCPKPLTDVRVVQDVDALKKLKNCFVHVTNTATTYFVASDHMPTVIASQPLFIDNYDYKANPRKLISQTVYDFRSGRAIVYNNKGKYRLIKLYEEEI